MDFGQQAPLLVRTSPARQSVHLLVFQSSFGLNPFSDAMKQLVTSSHLRAKKRRLCSRVSAVTAWRIRSSVTAATSSSSCRRSSSCYASPSPPSSRPAVCPLHCRTLELVSIANIMRWTWIFSRKSVFNIPATVTAFMYSIQHASFPSCSTRHSHETKKSRSVVVRDDISLSSRSYSKEVPQQFVVQSCVFRNLLTIFRHLQTHGPSSTSCAILAIDFWSRDKSQERMVNEVVKRNEEQSGEFGFAKYTESTINDVCFSRSGFGANMSGRVRIDSGASASVSPRWFGCGAIRPTREGIHLRRADGNPQGHGKRRLHQSKLGSETTLYEFPMMAHARQTQSSVSNCKRKVMDRGFTSSKHPFEQEAQQEVRCLVKQSRF